MKTGPLLTTGLPQFLKEGGYLRYVPSTDEDGKTTWELFGVGADGKVRTVWVTSTSQRTFRSANTLLAFHCRIYRGETSLLISTTDIVDTKDLAPPED